MFKLNEISLYTLAESKITMGKGYQIDEIKQKLVDVLQDSKIGLSGIEKTVSIQRQGFTNWQLR
ncbi:MAG: hypothetical protein P8X83_03765 [Nitrosopumilaceae archaeon]